MTTLDQRFELFASLCPSEQIIPFSCKWFVFIHLTWLQKVLRTCLPARRTCKLVFGWGTIYLFILFQSIVLLLRSPRSTPLCHATLNLPKPKHNKPQINKQSFRYPARLKAELLVPDEEDGSYKVFINLSSLNEECVPLFI